MRTPYTWALLAFGLTLASAACEDERTRRERSVTAPDTLVATATLSIGGASGQDHEIVSRAVSGFIREDQVFVAHGGGPEVRVYDLEGRLVSRVGREGAGPGEFRQLRSIAPLYPDSMMVLDASLLRISVFRADTFARSFELNVRGGQSGEWIGTHNGRIGVAVTRMPDPRSVEAGQALRDSLVIIFIPSGPQNRQDTVHAPPVGGRFWQMRETLTAFSVRAIEDGPRALVSGQPGALIVARGDVPEVLKWNGGSWDTVALNGLDRRSGEPSAAPGVPGRLLEDLAVTSEGGIWVGLAGVDTKGRRRWVLYDKGGTAVALVDLPAGFISWQAEEDWMLGRRIDDAGVEFVELLSLHH